MSAELLVRLPLAATVQNFFKTLKKSAHIITSKAISDHWKEVVLPRLAVRMIGQSLTAFALMLLCVSPFLVASLIGNSFSLDLLGDLLDPVIILFITAVAWIYLGVVRKWINARI